jgi:hypothetical protein
VDICDPDLTSFSGQGIGSASLISPLIPGPEFAA